MLCRHMTELLSMAGEYVYLKRCYGRPVAFLFSWCDYVHTN